MKSSSLENKVVRPGGFYYHSDRHAKHVDQPDVTEVKPVKTRRRFYALLLVMLLIGGGFFLHAQAAHKTVSTLTVVSKHNTAKPAPAASTPTPTKAAAVAPVATGPCGSNALSQLAVVSISQRHMWACEGAKVVYDSPVVTGIEYLAADLTPTGTYHIRGKETNLTLTGSDSTGSWSDPVSYWMPFLYNQYGAYGFHDATWRADSAFGNIDPNSSDASHGCVELPLATAAWLYNWAPVGTTVTIES